MSGSKMEQVSKWYASVFVGWAGSFGRVSWSADVVENNLGLGIVHEHVAVCADGSCGLADWTPLVDLTPKGAIAFAMDVRDAVIQARTPHEGAPLLSDVLIDTLGDVDHVHALVKACIPVWDSMARKPRSWLPLLVVGPLFLISVALGVWYFFVRAGIW